MSTPKTNTMHFISLRDVSSTLGARTHKEFLKDLRSLTPQERRDVAEAYAEKKGG